MVNVLMAVEGYSEGKGSHVLAGVRELTAELLQCLCRGSSHLRFDLLLQLVELLPNAVLAGAPPPHCEK